jgi:hypothetical protein
MTWLFGCLDRTARPWPLAVMLAVIAVWRTLMQRVLDRLLETSGKSILDYEILYSRQRVVEVFSAYGVEGMRLYKQFMAYDLAFPALYGVFFASLIHFGVRGTRYRLIVLAPLAMALFDYLENGVFYVFIRSNPDIPGLGVAIANVMTLAKFGFGGLSAVGGLVAAILLVRSRLPFRRGA